MTAVQIPRRRRLRVLPAIPNEVLRSVISCFGCPKLIPMMHFDLPAELRFLVVKRYVTAPRFRLQS